MAATPARQTLGLLGFGAFGRFASAHLARHFTVLVHDVRDIAGEAADGGVRPVAIEEAAGAPIVVLAVPVQRLEGLLESIRGHVRPDALVIDVSSVKIRPLELMERELPKSVQLIG